MLKLNTLEHVSWCEWLNLVFRECSKSEQVFLISFIMKSNVGFKTKPEKLKGHLIGRRAPT